MPETEQVMGRSLVVCNKGCARFRALKRSGLKMPVPHSLDSLFVSLFSAMFVVLWMSKIVFSICSAFALPMLVPYIETASVLPAFLFKVLYDLE